MGSTKNKQSKFLSLILRHHPEKIGVALDENGFVEVSDIIEKTDIDLETLKEIVENNDKKRFEFSVDHTKIRAVQGHSVEVDLELIPLVIETELILYHGTSSDSVDGILSDGLKPGTRQHCHISADLETAKKVGSRHSKDIAIFKINAKKMYDDGQELYQAKNGVYLANHVDPIYMELINI